ncbi:pyruvate dehydrogenase E1 component alpha subunit [Nocardiopsis arvandica]|uniref:Pyruvate dehydrogenase E1 component alpha subunit n=1 Tax=Nocardiopsis sinuspersici TaxID=501010 RepID=A0A7Y9XH19_9ACTN|nr:thiamine pyrophosphate-dependent dehydrogenase E1 component subunit alpha [Nocardiopsis sinuspersici]NYH55687.1 pyruvate dehydrogenase E1 component alpha subunit [Nocardiopsis sinuspersici]
MTSLPRMLRAMVRIRTVETALAKLYRDDQEMRTPTHFSAGQEATAVGMCSALRPDDRVYSGHRSHAPYLAKGGSLNAMVAELYGKRTGCAGGRGGSMHLTDPKAGFMAASILGETIAVGTGDAWASVMRGSDQVTAVFFGDGAAEEGVFHESLNFAALHRLPLVLVCENNGYSITSPLTARQPRGVTVWERARGYGVHSALVDGNDVSAVYDAAVEAVHLCRQGRGPYLLELPTRRLLEHVGPHPDRDAEHGAEAGVAERACPVVRASESLRSEDLGGRSPDRTVGRWRREAEEEVRLAVEAARSAPFPSTSTLLDGVHHN